MLIAISPAIRNAVAKKVRQVELDGRFFNVYSVAQEIQDAHPAENVALEDIVAVLVEAASGRSLGLEFTRPERTNGTVIDIVVADPA